VKDGLRTEFGLDLLVDFYSVFARNMRDLGTPVLPRRFFEGIARRVPGAEVAVVYHGARAVAAGVGFHHAGEFEITWASSLGEYDRLSPDVLLHWSLMQRAIEQGRSIFNFGGCKPAGSTHHFSRQWGGRDVGLHWSDSAQAARGDRGDPDGDGAARRVATGVWRRLPVSVASRVGPLVSPSLAWF
jgi:serine/alanine adding enzyme